MEPTITNEQGGSQSDIGVRFDLIPPEEISEVARILSVGAKKYGCENWKLIPTEDHINHAIAHLFKYLSGDRSENHLGNACCRCLFAMWSSKPKVTFGPIPNVSMKIQAKEIGCRILKEDIKRFNGESQI